jgi:hypothetical protein
MIDTKDENRDSYYISDMDLLEEDIEVTSYIRINDIIREVRVNLGCYTPPFKTHDLW